MASRAEIANAVEKGDFNFVTANIFNDLHGVLGQQELRLYAMRQRVGPRGVENVHLYDNIHNCLFLVKLLDEHIGLLLNGA